MSEDDVICMAWEAGGDNWGVFRDLMPELQRFANIVAIRERELCAETCERRVSLYWMQMDKTNSETDRAAAIASEECAAAIRARGEK